MKIRMIGLSLVELMIAMTLGLAVVAAVGWVYLGTVQTYRSQDAIAQMQEGARYAFEVIGNDLRMMGTTGCGYTDSVNVLNNYSTTWYENVIDQPIVSSEKDGATGVTQYSDALRVLRADIAKEYIVQSDDSTKFTLTQAHDVTQGQLMIATDCSHAAVFQAGVVTGTTISHAAGGTPGNSTVNLGSGNVAYPYSANSRLYRLSATTYYVAMNPAGVPSLYKLSPSGVNATPTAEELIEGVEDFQVSYGVDTSVPEDGEVDSAGGNPYLRGDQINTGAVPGANAQEKWNRVVSVRVSLLMRTVDNNVAPSAQTYTFNGTTTTATDKRLRKVFTHVIKLRNR